MKIFAPNYYKNFKCTADKCKNNCCIGWEIDIDGDTLEFYKTKAEIIGKIALQDTPHFILKENDRCPFLEDDNLCYIIKNYGEDKLCQICADHPRFRSFFETRVEIGLGLVCEAAAKLILDNDFSLTYLEENSEEAFENKEEQEFFGEREKLFNTDFDSLSRFLPDISLPRLADFLSCLERLDNKWDEALDKLKAENISIKNIKITDRKKAGRLLNYFIFRHYHEYSLSFCLTCTYIILAVGGDIYEAARMFSGEIEYSDENMEKLFNYVSPKK